MCQNFRNSVLSTLFFVYILIGCTILINSCATMPSKKVKTSTRQGSESAQNSENIAKSKQTVEQKLDQISKRLQKIEQVLGLNEFDIVDSESQDIEQNRDIVDDSESISESDITENVLPSDNNSDNDIQPDSSTKADTIYSKSNQVYQQHPNTEFKESSSKASSGNSPEGLYSKARSLLASNKFEAAEKEFKALAQSYPNHPLAVNSYYWMGECRYSTKDYKGAIAVFKELVEKYPNGRKVPDALLKTAYSYLAVKDKDNGREYLKKVIKQFPFTPAGEKAEQRLQALK